ncbi:hypothetical protein Tco_0116842 [Tanacetum coccineum]
MQDEEIARQWDEEERQRAMSEAKSTKKIDWNDPSVIRGRMAVSQETIRISSEMLEDFDKTRCRELYILVKESMSASRQDDKI